MGVFGYIRRVKEEFAQERHMKTTSKLSGLREQRLKAEGRAKVSRLYDEEKERVKAAKKEQFQRSFTGKAIAGAQRFQKQAKKRSARISKAKSERPEINPAFNIGRGKGKSIFD